MAGVARAAVTAAVAASAAAAALGVAATAVSAASGAVPFASAHGMRTAIRRGTKLLATVGPASSQPDVLRRMVDAGGTLGARASARVRLPWAVVLTRRPPLATRFARTVDMVRFNFSHGTHEDHLARVNLVNEVRAVAGVPLAMLQDLCGPKIRTTPTPDNRLIALRPGDTFTIVSSKDVLGDPHTRTTGTIYEALAQEVQPGDRILLSDGLIAVEVRDIVDRAKIVCTVLNGGALKGSQGINVPSSAMNVAAVTPKDVADLEFGMAHGFDWVAASFVRSPADILQLRGEMDRINRAAPRKHLPRVMAKIEKPQALDRLDSILDVVDGIMVARGDLGVEMRPEEVPIAQKRIVAACNRRGIPVVVATQMLESMIQYPRPTRAEVSDVCNAIFDGADACMLSAETASGAFPVESVQVMQEVAAIARANPEVDTSITQQLRARRLLTGEAALAAGAVGDVATGRPVCPPTVAETHDVPPPLPGSLFQPGDSAEHLLAIQQESLGAAAAYLAREIHAAAIVVFTFTGRTALAVAKHRPTVPIFAFTTSPEVARQVSRARVRVGTGPKRRH